MKKFAQTGDFCPHEACPDYGKLQNAQQRNIKKSGRTKKGVQRYQCNTCHRTFTATTRLERAEFSFCTRWTVCHICFSLLAGIGAR
jgi:transposase-like protein